MTRASEITTRTIDGPADVQACIDIFFAAFNDLHARLHVPLEDPADDAWLRKALEHFAHTDPGGTLLALEDGRPVAFGTAYRREDFWFLAFLFVLPDAQSRGIGRMILEELLPGDDERPRMTLATVVEAIQPVSTGLYASYGMAPRTPRYALKGIKRIDELPGLPGGTRPIPLERGSVDACAELDRAILGYTRPQDHLGWLGDGDVGTAYVDDAGSIVGYGYVSEGRYVMPVASLDERFTAAILGDLLAGLDRPEDAFVAVFGSSGVLLETLLRSGMRVDPESPYPFVYCSSDPTKPGPSYIAASGYLP